MFFPQQEIVVFFPDCINSPTSRQKILHEKIPKAVNSGFRIIYRRVKRSDVLNSTLNFRVVWQAVEKTDPALGAFDSHLCPKSRWIGSRAAEIGYALPNQTGCTIQAAQ